MTLQEEITALLHGDLVDENRVEELMHVLAVSPEKRVIFIEQIRLARAMTSLGASVAPPRSADENIWQGLAAIDNEIAGRSSEAPHHDPPASGYRPSGAAPRVRRAAGLAGLLLIAFVMGVEYLALRSNEPAPATHQLIAGTPAARAAAGTTPPPGAAASPVGQLPGAQSSAAPGAVHAVSRTAGNDSIDALRAQLSALSGRYKDALREIAALSARDRSPRVVYRDRPAANVTAIDTADASNSRTPSLARQERTAPSVLAAIEPRTQRPAALAAARHAAGPDAAAHASAMQLAAAPSDDEAGIGQWQIGVRDQFRLSLPRIYGLEENRSIFFDRDLFVSYRIDNPGNGAISAWKLSLTGGETKFAQVFHKDNGGLAVDETVTQAPTVQYARVVVAPEVLHAAHMTGSVEFGGGYALSNSARVGPIATLGVTSEYRPIDRVGVQLGFSTWLLLSEFQAHTIVSTNINAHLGFAIGF